MRIECNCGGDEMEFEEGSRTDGEGLFGKFDE